MALFRILLQSVATLALAVVLLAPATEAGLRGQVHEKENAAAVAVAPSPSTHIIDLAARNTVATPPTCTASHVEALPACVNMLAEPAVAAQLSALDDKLGHVSSLTMPVAAITACQTALEREGGCELPRPACGSDMPAGVVSFKACARALMGRKDHGQVLTVDGHGQGHGHGHMPVVFPNSNQDTDTGTVKDASITKDTATARAMGHAVAARGNEGDARTTALVLAATPANKTPKTASTSTTKTPKSKTTSQKKSNWRCRAKLDEVVRKKARRDAMIMANLGLGQNDEAAGRLIGDVLAHSETTGKAGGKAGSEAVDDDSAKYGDKKEGNCANLRKKTPAEQKKRCLKEAGDHCLKTCSTSGGASSKKETKAETETAAETGSYKDHLKGSPASGTSSGSTCWEAYVPKFASRCGRYTKAGYTCVNKHCAAMNPGGDPHICAKKMPEGSLVDPTTGRCVGPPPPPLGWGGEAKVMTADEFLQRGDGSSPFTEGGAGNIGKESGRPGAPMDAARSAVSAWKAATRATSKSPVVAKAVTVKVARQQSCMGARW
jgi:hypothetical protein